jgi:hypothetical protein
MIISDLLYIKNMKRLYKASYNVVIYAEHEEVLRIANSLEKETILDLNSLEEVVKEEDLPPEWDGELSDKDISQIFDLFEERDSAVVKAEIDTLYSCIEDIKKRIEELAKKL